MISRLRPFIIIIIKKKKRDIEILKKKRRVRTCIELKLEWSLS
jgi:hypothetical protein